jgi:hypothetical protein
MHNPIVTPARRGYSARNRKRHSREKRLALVIILGGFIALLILSL